MNCKILSFKICKEIEDYISISGHMQEDIIREREVDFTNSIGKEIELEEYQTKISAIINSLLDNLYIRSKEENFIFYDAPLSVYKNDIKNKFKKYFKLNIDALEIEFYEDQLELLNQPENFRILIDQYGYEVNYHYLLKNKKNFETSLKRKKESITAQINRLSQNESYNDKIFTSKETQAWFNSALSELNALDVNKKAKKRFQAKANAIFSDSTCKKVIFKYDVLLKDFIVFLNKEYKAGIKAKDKLSNGLNHSTAVENLIQLYKES
jgi:hypothetical protein